MCGIAGVVNFGTATTGANQTILSGMVDAMQSRGPDQQGLWINGSGTVGLAHCRLAIIDTEQRSRQPMTFSQAGLHIVFNGEVYNYQSLRQQLEEQGERFETYSDTEVILRLFARKREAMLADLKGMYAICIWDEHRQELFCARDPLGIKPLYLAEQGRRLLFASQVKALFNTGKIDTQPDLAGHVGFFLLGSVPEPHTLYQSIRMLPAGSWLKLSSDGTRTERSFFCLSHLLNNTEPAPKPLSRDQLAEFLLESLGRHCISDVPALLLLSAGKDSGVLAQLGQQLPRDRDNSQMLDTLTVAFDQPSVSDERSEAALLANQLAGRHLEYLVSAEEFRSHLAHLLHSMDQPTIDGVNVYWAAKATAKHGYKVALSGLGGDELFGGYPSFHQIPQLVALLGWIPGGKRLGVSLRKLLSPWLGRFISPKYSGLLEYGTNVSDAWYLRRALWMPWELDSLLQEFFPKDQIRQGFSELLLGSRLAQRLSQASHASLIALESSWYMRNQLLRDADWASMAHSVELRVPLVDHTLISNLAPWLVSGHPPGKELLTATPNRSLPERIVNRPKTGFASPQSAWLDPRKQSALRRGDRAWSLFVYREMVGSG